jgi:hypothetical protein
MSNEKKCIKGTWTDTPPSSLLDPKKVQLCQIAEVDGTWRRSQLPALKGVRGACWKLRDYTRKKDNLISYSVLNQKPTISWLGFILDHFWCWDKPRATRTHLTHHSPDSGEATTFPHVLFSAFAHGTYIRMAFCPGTPKEESRNYPGLDSRDFRSS